MGAILLVEWTTTDPERGRESADRLVALTLIESARVLFTATDRAASPPAMLLAAAFAQPERARTALTRWQAEGALPAEACFRILTAEATGQAEAPLLLFP